MKWLLFIIILSPFLTPLLAQAQTQSPGKIEFDPPDGQIRINGWVGKEDTFVGNVGLIARDGPVNFSFRPSDLTSNGGDVVVPRQNVTLSGTPTLTMTDVPKDFQVQVAGVDIPGIYTGTLTFIPVDQPDQQEQVLLTVVAKARPALTALPGTDSVKLQLVDCHLSFDCFLGQYVLPISFFMDSFQLQFKNTQPITVGIADATVNVRGEQTGYQLTDKDMNLAPIKQPASPLVTIPVAITRSVIPPDHYTGYIYLTLINGEESLPVPVDLNVRTDPLWPLIALTIGILLGKAVKFMQDRGNKVAERMIKASELEDSIKIDPEESTLLKEDRNFLLMQVHYLRFLILSQRLVEADQEYDKIGEVKKLLKQANTQESPHLEEVRKSLYAGDCNKAHELMTNPNQQVTNSPTHPPTPASLATSSSGQPKASTRRKKKRTWKKQFEIVVVRVWNWIELSASKLDPLKLQRSSVQLASYATVYLQPFLTFVLLLTLVIVGLNSLYMTNAIFGAHPLPDLLGLVLWGLSADVVSRNLGNLGSDNVAKK